MLVVCSAVRTLRVSSWGTSCLYVGTGNQILCLPLFRQLSLYARWAAPITRERMASCAREWCHKTRICGFAPHRKLLARHCEFSLNQFFERRTPKEPLLTDRLGDLPRIMHHTSCNIYHSPCRSNQSPSEISCQGSNGRHLLAVGFHLPKSPQMSECSDISTSMPHQVLPQPRYFSSIISELIPLSR